MDRPRDVLEVLKFSSPLDVLSQLNLVSQLWAKASANNEVWDSLSDSYCYSSRDAHESGLEAYRRRLFFTKKVTFFSHSELHFVDFRKNAHKVTNAMWLSRPYIGYFCVLLPSNEVIVTGGTCISNRGLGCLQPQYISDEVAIVSEGDIRLLCQLTEPRTHHSAICYRDSLYLFGGLSYSHLSPAEQHEARFELYNAVEVAKPIALRERMNLTKREKWERMPDMLEARIDFTVCLHAQVIYLGSFDATKKVNTVETYQPDTQVSAYLTLTLPDAPVLFTAVMGHSLLLLRKDGYTAVDLISKETTENVWSYFDERSRQSGGRANSNLVAVGNCLFQVSEEYLFMFDLEKKTRRAWTPHEPTKGLKRKSF